MHTPYMLHPTALMLFTPIGIPAEGRRHGYTADHKDEDERHHDLADRSGELPGSRIHGVLPIFT
jgi:hypothetical protein